MKILTPLILILISTTTQKQFDFLVMRIPDDEPLFHVVAPMIDGLVQSEAFILPQSQTPKGVLPIIFIDTMGRESELYYIEPIKSNDLTQYVKELHKKIEEENLSKLQIDSGEILGKINSDKVVLSLDQAIENNKTTGQKMSEKFDHKLIEHYKKNKRNVRDKVLSEYDDVLGLTIPEPHVNLSLFPTTQVTDKNIINIEHNRVDAIYVKVEDREEIETPHEEDHDQKLDIYITRRDNYGRLLSNKIGIFVMMKHRGNLLLELEGDVGANIFVDKDPTVVWVRVMFIDDFGKRASLPYLIEATNRIDPDHVNSILQDEKIVLNQEIALEYDIYNDIETKTPEKELTDYTELQGIEVVNNINLAENVVGDKAKVILEVDGEGSIIVVKVGFKSEDERK